MKNYLLRIQNWLIGDPSRTLRVMLLIGLGGLLYLALPDSGTKSYGVSAGYKETAALFSSWSPKGFIQAQGALYPLVLAIGAGLGMAHYVAVGLFNIIGIGVLVSRMHTRGLSRMAMITGATAGLLLFSQKNLGFATARLPESIALGGMALVVTLLFEAYGGKRDFKKRMGFTLGAIFLGYHVSPALLFGMTLLLPMWVWALAVRSGVAGTHKLAIHAAIGTLLVVGGIGMLNGQPQMVDNIKDGQTRISTFALSKKDAGAVRKLAKEHGRELPGAMLQSQPGLFVTYGFKRVVPALWNGFVKNTGSSGVCSQGLGHPRGLPGWTCSVTAWATYFGYSIMFLGGLAAWGLRRKLEQETAAVLLLAGGFWGIAAAFGFGAFTSTGRYLYFALAYGMLAMPLTALFFRPVFTRLRQTNPSTAWSLRPLKALIPKRKKKQHA
ncbi:MAG: hypothetical protein OEY97_06965 [Nitrospirota bacterium]|nr:hypothetical protein [Nitrospirota bacterium]